MSATGRATAPAATPASPRRFAEIDAVRGVVIVLVVAAHMVLGSVDAGSLDEDGVLVRLYDWSHPVRSTVMFLVAGVFIESGVRRNGAGRYVARRCGDLVWLYLVWYLIETSFEVAAGSLTNGGRTLDTGVLAVWSPPAHLWFLPTLAVGTAVIVLLQLVARRVGRWVVPTASIGLALALWGWGPSIAGLTWISTVALLAVAWWIGRERVSAALEAPTWCWVVTAALATAAYAGLAATGVRGPVEYAAPSQTLVDSAVDLVATLVGCTMTIAVAVCLARVRPFAAVLTLLGRHSLEIYLAHIILGAGTRIVLEQAGAPAWASFSGSLLVGVAGPLVVGAAARRFGMSWLFERPRFRAADRAARADVPALTR